MTERYFIEMREEHWKQFETLVYAPQNEFKKYAPEFPAMLRALTGDLNTAKANGFDPLIIERLNRLTFDGNQLLCSVPSFSFKALTNYFICTLPQTIRATWHSFAAFTFLFYGIALFSALLCVQKKDFTDSILGYKQMASLEDMYNKDSEHYLKPREITKDADMFGFYIYNNISIGFRTFAGGIFAGVGSLFFLIYNAFFLGAAAGHLINKGYAETFFSFVSGHSAFELTGIILSAQAGFILGYNLFVTGGLSRSASLRKAGKRAFPLLAGAALLCFFAAIIEAFWSSKHEIGASYHYMFGAAMWLFLLCYILLCGRTKRSAVTQ